MEVLTSFGSAGLCFGSTMVYFMCCWYAQLQRFGGVISLLAARSCGLRLLCLWCVVPLPACPCPTCTDARTVILSYAWPATAPRGSRMRWMLAGGTRSSSRGVCVCRGYMVCTTVESRQNSRGNQMRLGPSLSFNIQRPASTRMHTGSGHGDCGLCSFFANISITNNHGSKKNLTTDLA